MMTSKFFICSQLKPEVIFWISINPCIPYIFIIVIIIISSFLSHDLLFILMDASLVSVS